jgi:uncharacterized membrane protein
MTDDDPEDQAVEDLIDDLEALEDLVDTPDEREQVREAIRLAREVERPSVFGRVMSGFDRNDAAQALLGSTLFGLPMLVEGGTQEVGDFLATRPLYYGATFLAGVTMVAGILYATDIQDVRIHRPLFGLVPRKFAGVLAVSGLMAVVSMTVWGRVDWNDPTTAVARTVVCFVPMAIGAALGDILPGD